MRLPSAVLFLGIGNISSYGFAINATLPLLIGLITAVLFVYRQFHQETAFLELRILKIKKLYTQRYRQHAAFTLS